MPVPVRSIRLQKRSSQSLDTLSGASGEIFFDADRGTLRLYTANQSDNVILADREWVTANTFSGSYSDLVGAPASFSSLTSLAMTTGVPITEFSDDDTLEDQSVGALVTERAIKTYVDGAIAAIPAADITTLDNVGDVDTTTEPLVNGQLLQWDGEKWQNATVTGFVNTDTTYTLDKATSASPNAVDLNLTDSDAVTTSVTVVGGSGINVAVNLSDELEISNSATYAINDLSDVNITNPQLNNVLKYDGSQWIAGASSGGGIALTDISVGADDPASGSGALAYDDTTGVFTYTPPELIGYADFSVTTNAANAGGSLSYDDAGGFTFEPADIGGALTPTSLGFAAGVAISEFSTDGTFSGNSNTAVPTEAAIKTYVDTNAGGVSDIVDDTTPQLGGDLDLNSNNVIGTGNINITGTVTATSYSTGSTGAPSITSASTITFTAPDGIIFDGITSDIVATKTSSTGIIAHDLSADGAVYLHTSISGNFTANFTNVPTTNSRSISVVLVLQQGATPYVANAVQVAGAAQTIYWNSGSPPTGTANGVDVIGFNLLRTSGGAWIVIGNAASYS